MKFATIGHLDNNDILLKSLSKDWLKDEIISSPELNFDGAEGHFIAIKLTPRQMMNLPKEEVRQKILEAVNFAQDQLGVELIQLGALTTSVTCGGKWIEKQVDYRGYVNHGDSYTASVTCQAVMKTLKQINKDPENLVLAIVGCYGIIGEAVSKILVPKFEKSILIGRQRNKLNKLTEELDEKVEAYTSIKTKDVDVIVTATNHPDALLKPSHLKKNAVVIDVSQPVNLSPDICQERPDVIRIDGGYVDFKSDFRLPGAPPGKIFSCIAEVIMQAKEENYENHVGAIDLDYLEKVTKWGKKYGYFLRTLTNFGKKVDLGRKKS
ncbi:MAG: hypothetical protein V5A68_08015 [Candidatus Thermoplasmatota archaeon]